MLNKIFRIIRKQKTLLLPLFLVSIATTVFANDGFNYREPTAGGTGNSSYVGFADNETTDINWTYNFTTTGKVSVGDSAYGAGWNGDNSTPTKNALYDKIETISTGNGTGNVSTSAAITDNAIVRGDGGSTTVQPSGVIIDDSNNVLGMGNLGVKTLNLTDGTNEYFIHNSTLKATVTDALLSQSGFLWVSGKYVYQTALGDDTLNIIDISNPESPHIVGQLTNSTYLDQSEGVIVIGKYALVTSIVSDSLSVIDVSDPTSPTIAATLVNSTTLNGVEFVTVAGHYAYLASYAGARFTVVDIADPLNPQVVGSLYDVTNLSSVIYIAVKGDYAYATGSGSKKLSVINISDPTNPVVTDSIGLTGAGTVAVRGKYAYVTGYVNAKSLFAINISDPYDINYAGNFTDNTNLPTPLTVKLGGDYAYVTCYGATAPGLAIINISDPANMTLAKKITDASFGGLDDIQISGGYAYCSDNTGGKLHIIKLPGLKTQTFEGGNGYFDRVDVNGDSVLDGNVYMRSGATVGTRGLFSLGDIATYKNMTVNNTAYGADWNGSNKVPTQDAVYDKFESLSTGGTPGGADLSVQINRTGAFDGITIGSAGQYFKVNSTGDGYEWGSPAGSGNVTQNGTTTSGNLSMYGASDTEIVDSGYKTSDFLSNTSPAANISETNISAWNNATADWIQFSPEQFSFPALNSTYLNFYDEGRYLWFNSTTEKFCQKRFQMPYTYTPSANLYVDVVCRSANTTGNISLNASLMSILEGQIINSTDFNTSNPSGVVALPGTAGARFTVTINMTNKGNITPGSLTTLKLGSANDNATNAAEIANVMLYWR